MFDRTWNMPLYYKHRFYFFIKIRIIYKKNLTLSQNQIKYISINTCSFDLILEQSQIMSNY